MKTLKKYLGWGIGILLLVMIFFPHLFFPTGLVFGTLAIFTQACSKNVSGAVKIFIAERAVATSFTAGADITAVTGTTPFVRVDILQDSLSWTETEEKVGLNNCKISNTIEFDIMAPGTLANAFVQSLIDASPCGLFALIVDGNGKCWVVGFNATDIRERPLRLTKVDDKTGKGLAEAEGNTIRITLSNEGGGISLPLSSALNSAVLAGNATICKWS